MSFPDFSKLGYQIECLLGQNRACGRVTYMAKSIDKQLPVVIKQVQLAQLGTSWLDYDAYQREVQVLQQLDHPSIPRYLNSFVTTTGFYLVQEYKKAACLAQPQHWTPAEIKQIAVAVLEVLVYLQQQVHPMIHRDIKPENILVDNQGELHTMQVTLVDFGFACIGGEVAASSVVKGTLGFMPPEQVFNRQLTEASDLYSLGVTLLCLLTQTKSTEVGHLIDDTYHFNFKRLLPQLSLQFVDWLKKMVAPSLKDRYPNAVTALKALQPIDVSQITTVGMLPTLTKRRWLIPAAVGLPAIVAVTMLSKVVFSGVNLALYQPPTNIVNRGDLVKLLATNQCPRCNLTNANLSSANLTAANLEGANLGNAFLGSTNFQKSNLGSAYLGGALLGKVNLENAYLGSAYLENAYLGDADLKAANLRNADLRGANLRNASLQGAYLEDADLTGAKLRGANLTGAYLEGADLTGADLTNTKLEGTRLKGAKMPNGKIHP